MSRIRRRLSVKLGLSILALAVPIFILAVGILFMQSRHLFREQAAKRADNALNTVMQEVRNYMNTVETATNATTWLVEAHFQPDSLLAISRRIVQLNRHVNGCSITAEPDMFPQCGRYFSAYTIREGDSIITAREAEYNYYEKSWYKEPRQQGKACWVDPFDDFNEGTLSTNEVIASYCRPVFSEDGNKTLVGVISTDLSFRHLSETIYGAERPYSHAYYILIGADGQYFIHPDSTRVFKRSLFTDYTPDKHPDIIALGHEMTAGHRGQTTIKHGRRLYNVSYRPVPGTDWSLALVCPDNEVLRSYHRLTYIVGLLIFLGLIAIVLLCRNIVNMAVEPITILAHKSQRITEGHFDEIISPTRRRDAVGQLQNSFATMQCSLQERIASIQQATLETAKRNDDLVVAKQKAEEAVHKKDLFLQNVSHQIRTPLNIILGFADVLKDNPQVASDAAEISAMMRHNALHLNRMVIMLFDSSDAGASEELLMERNERVQCNDIGRECVSYVQARFPDATLRFTTTLADEVSLTTNRLYLMRTIRELLYNSAKYSDGQHILLAISEAPTSIRFVVEDMGPGIPEELRDTLFEPFAKVDDLSEGLGLGLPLTKRHVLAFGGDITLDTDYHAGCRIIITLPKD